MNRHPGDVDDLLFVETDERSEHRQRCHGLDCGHVLDGLGRDLAETFAGDEGAGVEAASRALGEPEHEPAIEQDPERGRAAGRDLFLDLEQGHHGEPGLTLVAVEDPNQIRTFSRLAGSVRGTEWKWTKSSRIPRFIIM